MPDRLTCLLRNLYAGEEATLKPDTEQQTGSILGKQYVKAVYYHFANVTYAEYITRNAGLDEAHTGIKTAEKTINNLRCADDTTLMAENEDELMSLLMKVKEESVKTGFKLNIQKQKAWHLVPSLHGKQTGK